MSGMSKWQKIFLGLVAFLEKIRLKLHMEPGKWVKKWKDADPVIDADFSKDADSTIIYQEPVRAKILLRLVSVSILIFFLWAALVHVDEITKGEAKVIPSQQLQVYPSLDGGIVSDILVKEGQIVNEGQELIKIDPTRFESSLGENRSSYLSLTAKAARLRALGEAKPLEMPEEVLKENPTTAEEEARLYETANSEINAQVSIAREQLAQRGQEQAEASARQRQAAIAYENALKELNFTKPLLNSGAVSEVEILRLERDVARFKGERDVAAAQVVRAGAAISEANRKIQEVELSVRNNAKKELSETMSKLNSLVQSGTGLADRVKQSTIRSKVRGTVKRILVNTVGGVVQPGRDVVEVVPSEGKLILEAKVSPKDIAFLVPGQNAVVKFTAYDFSIYGGLDAKVEHIGADSVTDDKGNTYYVVRVATHKSTLSGGQPIIPGMVAEVDIITGKKTILSYILKPVLRAKQSAFTER